MSVNEVANAMGVAPTFLLKILRGDARLGPRYAFLLSELFSWKQASKWMKMQAELSMFEAGVDERAARKVLFNEDDGASADAWSNAIKEKWSEDTFDVDDYFEELHNPQVNPKENPYTTLQEEVENGTK